MTQPSTVVVKEPNTPAISWVQGARNLLLAGLRHRLVLASAGIAVTGGGLALGWDWLTAVGVAPLIVAAAPCLIMCAFGMCMIGKNHSTSPSAATPQAGEPPARTNPSPSPEP